MNDFLVQTFPVGPLQCNCTMIIDPKEKSALIVDPGGDPDKILGILNEHQVAKVEVIHTHAHLDHFLASGTIKDRTGANLAVHKEDKLLWDHLEDQCHMFGIPYNPVPDPDSWLEHEEELSIGSHCCGLALHTPGHTPGSMSFLFKDLNLLIAGDTLFKGGIGRTDLWGGDYGTIEKSIKNVIYQLDEAYDVVTSHGPATTIGEEVRNNPFIRA
ncbi:MAG: MBL fold metallo-hydrolase [Oligoflexales bacterium]|nr:MBL fold metallo-hydrolase [Oligoflexales bacterium]